MLQQYRKPRVYRLNEGTNMTVRFVQAFMPEDRGVMLLEVYRIQQPNDSFVLLLLNGTALIDRLIEAEPNPRGYTFSRVTFIGWDFTVEDETTSPSAPRFNLEKTYKQLVRNGTIPLPT
jgi:hypothetical protein